VGKGSASAKVGTAVASSTLCARGRDLAREVGQRRRDDGITATFGGTAIPVLHDGRLRECDYGERHGMPAAQLHADRTSHIDPPYPAGESWR
jgi:2,3-bisphosphoglycerate-dependent phosphoglycerate mutase